MDITLFRNNETVINSYLSSRNKKLHIIDNKLYIELEESKDLFCCEKNKDFQELTNEIYKILELYDNFRKKKTSLDTDFQFRRVSYRELLLGLDVEFFCKLCHNQKNEINQLKIQNSNLINQINRERFEREFEI